MIFNELSMMFAFFLILTGISSAALAAWPLTVKRKVYGAADLSLFLFAVSLYSFGYALEINQHTLGGIYDALKIQFLGIPFTAVFYLIFSIKLVTGKTIKYYWYISLMIIPLITVLLVFTIEKHNLFHLTPYIKYGGLFPVLNYHAGPWYIVNMVNLIASSAAAEIILLISYFKSRGLQRKQLLLVFLSGLLPVISAAVNPVRNFNLDLQPFFLIVTGILLFIALFRYRMFELVPYAREIAVDSIREIMLVFDCEGKVQDINLSAKRSELLENVKIGTVLQNNSPLKRFTDSISGNGESYPDNLEYQFEYNGNNYLLKISFIKNRNAFKRGFVFIVSNITKSVRIIKELEYQAIYDSLTGLFNRRHILDLASRELEIAVRGGTDIGVILIDIDFFKKINDTFGHQAGDNALKKTADILSKEIRVTDLLGRYGGEEFLVICPGSDTETTRAIAERLRKAVEKTPFCFEGNTETITSSFGIYSIIPSAAEKIGVLLKKADIALYKAKNNGRNRTEIYSDQNFSA